MWFRSCIVLVLVSGAVAAQDPATPAQPTIPIVRPVDPEFDALMLRYGAAIRDYDDVRIRMTRDRSKAPEPAHPAQRFLKDYQALAARDSGGAQGWILANLRFVVDEPAERLRLAREVFPMLLAKHVDEEAAARAIEGLRLVREDLGDDVVFEMATAIAEKTVVDEVRGQAKLLQAWARTQGDATKDPARWEEANEIYRDILYTIPKTVAGRQVSGILYRPLQEDFFARERKWVDELLDLQAQGKSPDVWPRQPMHDLLAEFQIIANAGHNSAQLFVNHLYPEYEMVERQGPGLACSWLVNKFGQYYSDGLGGGWNSLRADLLVVIYRQFPTERWVLDSLGKLLGQVEGLPFDRIELAMQALLEKSQDPRVRAAALFSMAQSVKSRGDQRSYELAIEYYTRVRDEYPKDALRQAAEGGRAELAPVMPGQPAPPIQLLDAEGLPLALANYKGRVVMLEFWSFNWPPVLAGIPARAELDLKYRGRPFSLLGINTDNRKSAPFHDLAAKHGVRWRCASTYSTNSILVDWAVRCQPTTILIDKDGIIRARDLPWAEMTALTEELVLEAEKSSSGDANTPK